MEAKFFRNFIALSLILIGLLFAHSYYIDSFDYWGSARKTPAWNNPHFLKLEYLRSNHFDCVIVGSSRAETISPYQLSKKLGADCVNLAVGGATAALKLLYIDEALKSNDLKYIVYVSDFYELFDAPYPDEIRFHTSLRKGVSEYDKKLQNPGLVDHFVMHLDQVRFNRDMKSFSNWDDTQFSPLGKRAEKPSFNLKNYLSDPDYKLRKETELKRDIARDFRNYADKIWQGSLRKDLLSLLNTKFLEWENKKIKTYVALTPYHPQFADMFFKLPNHHRKNYLAWKLKMSSFSGLELVDLNVLSQNYLDSSNRYWDDGVHLNKFGMALLWEKYFDAK